MILDVDECASTVGPCAKLNDKCVNLHGGYVCCDKDVADYDCKLGKSPFYNYLLHK